MKISRIIRTVAALGGFLFTIADANCWAQLKPDSAGDQSRAKPPVNRSVYPSIPDRPWFSHPEVRRELELTDEQYKKLHEGYGQALDRYDQKRLQLSPTVSEQERLKTEEDLHADFHKDVSKTTNDRIPLSIQRQRYNQLYWQHRGVGALNAPDIQSRLSLSDEQRLKFRKMERDWNDHMDGWHRTYAADPDRVLKRFNEGRAEFNEGIRTLLDTKQLEGWNELTGKPYEFPPEVYFQKNAVPRPATR